MRIFAISDIHIDFEDNRRWFENLSRYDYQEDLLILAGDVTDILSMVEKVFRDLRDRFSEVLYIPGNHDLWVYRQPLMDSLEKFEIIKKIASGCGVRMEPFHSGTVSIIPLFGWYDYSFGAPSNDLREAWVDYIACKWPEGADEVNIAQFFSAMNEPFLNLHNDFVISFSHFVPRIDVMPAYIPFSKRDLYSVMGSRLLEAQIRKLGSRIHIYGHSHINRDVWIDDTQYINNAFGYPYETRITMKKLKLIHEINNNQQESCPT
ncbi:MAG: metallophosphoesterase [Firmicutes bacterium]|nr:metallophosphoesterase [Bacillota bacterium]